ncbi:hypothetical protein M378DRAFT_820290 [Amanita muscaria Koide BX008]|uniref:Uncharacterized protein n=1 Tax=Amanita muscaria (strain Koide BX008) TaxID=946122 RepID=A0A0C2WJM1_AMAMK|nr:hypothetical protein M378DRAFT_820290 [Amanita muscaria Koide BX008]
MLNVSACTTRTLLGFWVKKWYIYAPMKGDPKTKIIHFEPSSGSHSSSSNSALILYLDSWILYILPKLWTLCYSASRPKQWIRIISRTRFNEPESESVTLNRDQFIHRKQLHCSNKMNVE